MQRRGNLYFDGRRQRWYCRWMHEGIRQTKAVGTVTQYPNRRQALKAADEIMRATVVITGGTFGELVQRYRTQEMPRRYSTARGYETWLRVHIVPKWGAEKIGNVKPVDVKDWLDSLALAPKSRVHIRWLMAKLFDCAMLWEMMPVQRNPLSVFKLKDSSKRQREPRILTAPEFSRLLLMLVEPFRTMATVAGCLGLRFCEVTALQWGDVDWLEKVIRIQRAVVNQHNGDVKTVHSRKPLPLEDSLIALLEQYHTSVEQKGSDDWLFASPAQAFEKPFSYTWCHDNLIEAGKNAGIGHIGWHDLRHTYRTWLNVVGAPMAVQQKLMRHADIRTTMNTYGDTMPEELREAHGKVVRMVLPS